MSNLEKIKSLYFIDDNGNYQKCHKLLPDIRRIFGEIEYLDGEPVEIITNEIASKNFKGSLAIGHSSEDAVCERIQKKYPKTFKKISLNNEIFAAVGPCIDKKSYEVDSNKIRSCGFIASDSINVGIKETIELLLNKIPSK